MKMIVTFVHKTLGPFSTNEMDTTPEGVEKWENILKEGPNNFMIYNDNEIRIFGKDILKEGYFIIEKTP